MRLSLAVVALVLMAGCSSSKTPTGPARSPSPGLSICGANNIFRGSDFSSASARIDNHYYPLPPGRQVILDGRSSVGGTPLPHRVVLTVTDLTKVIAGVRTVVLWDRDYDNDKLAEAELAFHAQDRAGNVWNLGEYPEEYQGGNFVGAPSTWIGRVGEAEPGIIIPGDPQLGYQFSQGYVADIDFLDCGMVFAMGQRTCIPFNCYENVLIIDEQSPLEPGSGHQRKYYAPGVGNVQIGAVDDPEGETLVVTNILELSPAALAEARQAALKLEARAYQVSDIYRHTLPMEPLAEGPIAVRKR